MPKSHLALDILRSIWYDIRVKNHLHKKEKYSKLPLDKLRSKCYNVLVRGIISEKFQPDFSSGFQRDRSEKTGLTDPADGNPKIACKQKERICRHGIIHGGDVLLRAGDFFS